jgi:hypothetical protein
MDKVEIYKRAKFQLNIHYNVAYKKIKKLTYVIVNSVNFYNLKICKILSILWSLEYKVFRIETLHIIRTKHCLHIDFFSEFFETFK